MSTGIDAIIMPNTPWVGYKPWTWVKSNAYVGYTSIWNLLGYAALTVPTTTVSREKDMPSKEWLDYVPRNAADKFNKEQCKAPFFSILVEVLTVATDDVDLVNGMPVGVQVVGGRFGDEKCVAVAKAIEQAMKWKNSAIPGL